jgi:hypothetical protein
MNVFWVSEGKPEEELSPEKEKEYSEANTIFWEKCGYIPPLQNLKRDV